LANCVTEEVPTTYEGQMEEEQSLVERMRSTRTLIGESSSSGSYAQPPTVTALLQV
jgi:hypothetical protein